MKLEELFAEFKKIRVEMRWRDWYRLYRLVALNDTFMFRERYGCNIIPLAKRSKRPRDAITFDTFYSIQELAYMIGEGYNVAIIANKKINFLDIDAKRQILPDSYFHVESARGYLYPFIADTKLWVEMPEYVDTIRAENMYIVAPPSITCLYDTKMHKDCKRHEWHIRVWGGNSAKILKASDINYLLSKREDNKKPLGVL